MKNTEILTLVGKAFSEHNNDTMGFDMQIAAAWLNQQIAKLQ